MEGPIRVGEVVAGKYEVERVLARGGIGLIVKAKHLKLLEPCAIKLILPEALEAPLARERFLREARACARLRSDYVVKVFDVGELEDETPYMVLEYLEGVDLDEHMGARPLPVAEAALYVLQVSAALAEAHALGIVHRDLKPANVFLARLADGSKRVKLLDFGISKLLEVPAGADQSVTLEGTVMGTPLFMSPEQVQGMTVDARTDIWAVGVLLYYLVTARFPFPGDVPTRTLALVLAGDPVAPSAHAPSLPPALEAIILRCLQKDPARRPPSVQEIAEAIAPFVADQGAPLVQQIRRIFESSADGRASQPGPVPPGQVARATPIAPEPDRVSRPTPAPPTADVAPVGPPSLLPVAQSDKPPPGGAISPVSSIRAWFERLFPRRAPPAMRSVIGACATVVAVAAVALAAAWLAPRSAVQPPPPRVVAPRASLVPAPAVPPTVAAIVEPASPPPEPAGSVAPSASAPTPAQFGSGAARRSPFPRATGFDLGTRR